MELLKNMILEKGKVFPGNILKVDSFLNHQVDPNLIDKIGEEFARIFANENITKVLTIESSGITMALAAAKALKVNMIFAKKTQTKNIAAQVYSSKVISYTHGKVYDIIVSTEYLGKDDRVLVIDDFLANGKALEGLIDIINQAGATLVGCGIAIEKAFQPGGDNLRARGIRVESLAKIGSMTDDTLSFVE
ncbi:MAG: xanthine phosphoribosyltransferase [Clostridia bacterium]|nr:xanthine phosphoribosyltransferase [Clostridia bacterium]